MAKVLVVATSRKTRGGITSVVKAHERGQQWKKYNCKWIETHRDGNIFVKLWYFIRALATFLIQLPFCDLVHIHFSEYSSARRKKSFVYLAWLFRKKIILHFHAPNPDNTYKKYPQFYQRIFAKGDLIIMLSERWRTDLLNTLKIAPEKVRVVFNPCPEVIPEHVSKQKYVLYAGTLNQRKGYFDLIKAFSQIASKYPEWKVIFAGNGEINNAEELAREYHVTDQIEFRGWVAGRAKDLLFKESSVFCLPSYAEGFPMAVLDAWAYGLPVVTTPVGGIPDIADNGKNVLLFNPGDVDGLARLLDQLIADEQLQRSLSLASFEMAHTTFNIQTINSEIEKCYASLCK